MSRASPNMQDLARHLIAFEIPRSKLAGANSRMLFPVMEKLRPHMVVLVGRAGFQALLSRALALGGSEVSWLRRVQVRADGSFPLRDQIQAQPAPKEFLKGRIVLLAQLLGLLAAFIGEELTLRLVREIWPRVQRKSLNFGK